MKRTLLEILSGLAVLVLLASFHHQLARLKVQNQEMTELRQIAHSALSKSSLDGELDGMRRRLIGEWDERMQTIDGKLQRAVDHTGDANRLKQELLESRREVENIRTQVARDVLTTRELVSAYHSEMRDRTTTAEATLEQTKTFLRDLAGRVVPDADALTLQMLAPTVQLNGDDTVGSGTLIYSARNETTGKADSYVITSYHVIRNILADTPSARRDGIAVTIYHDRTKIDVRGDMISHDEKIDAALMKLRTTEVFPKIARVLPRDRASRVKVWDPIYAVGCPLGSDPIPTQGEVSSTRNELNGSNYWMINAPTYFGNSGGGVYLAETRELIGVFSKIYTHGKGNPVVVPHMGLATPIDLIYRWLDRDNLEFVLTGGQPDVMLNVAAPAGR